MWQITNIQRFVNLTNEPIEILKREDINDRVSLLPGQEHKREDIHAPWVNNHNEFNQRTIEVRYLKSRRILYIWQHGDKIRASWSGYEDPGSAIFGEAPEAGGNKRLVVRPEFAELNNL